MQALQSLQLLEPPASDLPSQALHLCMQFCNKDFGENVVFLTLSKA